MMVNNSKKKRRSARATPLRANQIEKICNDYLVVAVDELREAAAILQKLPAVKSINVPLFSSASRGIQVVVRFAKAVKAEAELAAKGDFNDGILGET